MISVKEDTAIFGVSELRTKMDSALALAKSHRVVLGRRNKPVAVIVDIKKYEEMEEMLDALEDFALGYLARDRERSDPSDYVDLRDAEKIRS